MVVWLSIRAHTALAGLLCLGAMRLAGSAAEAERTPCLYFGRGSTTSGDRAVKSTCPPPMNRNVYYFKFDIDPGTGSETLAGAALVSPADAICDETTETCGAPVGPGYDLYAAVGCLPLPAAPGIESVANTQLSTRKLLALSTSSFKRFYVAAVRRDDTDYGSAGCSVALLPGYLGQGQGQKCSIVDYTPNGTITTSTIKTTVTTTTLNTTTNRTETLVTSSTSVTQSTTANPGESTGSATKTSRSGALMTTTTTTTHTSTVLTKAPEDVPFCEPKDPPIPPEYIFATIVLASIAAAVAMWMLSRWERRRAMRRMCIEEEDRFRQQVQERTISQDLAIENNAFEISAVLQARDERNDSIRSHKLARGAILKDNFMKEDNFVKDVQPVPGQGAFAPYGSPSPQKQQPS